MKPLPILVAVLAFAVSIGLISWLFQPAANVNQATGPLAESSNPLLDSASGPTPTAVLEQSVHEFGSMLLEEKGRHAFVIRNEGQAPLKLKFKKSTCKCTVPTIPDGGISVGESVEVVLDWETQYLSEDFSQHAVLWTNDPENPELTLQVVGKVVPFLTSVPPFPWMVGNIKEGEDATFAGVIASGSDEFEILSVESSEDWLTVEVERVDPAELKPLDANVVSGYQVRGRIRPEMVIGRFEARLTINTNLDVEDTPTGSVIGARSGPFSIIGPSWLGREMTLAMGDVASDQGKAMTLALFTDRQDDPVEIKSLTAVPDVLEVALVRDESFQTPVREKYDLTFRMPPELRPKRFIGDDRIDVTITTNRAGMEEVRLSVEATVK